MAVTITLKEVFTLFMAGYRYTKRSVHSSWLVTITLREVSALFMAVTITLKEVSALFMAGYSYTKISVHSLHDWLQLH